MAEARFLRPDSLGEAARLARAGGALVAGGQDLIPKQMSEQATPQRLVAIDHLDALRGIGEDVGALSLGAGETHAAIAGSETVRRRNPAIGELAEGIGDPQVRNLGTLGGALASGDPNGDYPPALVALGAAIHTTERVIPADAFFEAGGDGIAPGEIITRVAIPTPQAAAYAKQPHPAARYALVGVFVAVFADHVRIAATGLRPTVCRMRTLEEALTANFAAESVPDVVSEAAVDDIQASAEYRCALTKFLTRSAVEIALSRKPWSPVIVNFQRVARP